MKASRTLGRYLAGFYGGNMALVVLALWGIILLFDSAELLRRASKHDGVPLSQILQMSILHLPEAGFVILPFAVLFAAMFSFWQMTRRQELVVVRAAGFSVWQFLRPVLYVAVAAGILTTAVLNPMGAILLERYRVLEGVWLKKNSNHVALLDEGLWLRQSEGGDGGYVVLHASGVRMPGWRLRNVMVLSFDAQDNFRERMDAPEATLAQGAWAFRDAVFTTADGGTRSAPDARLPTNLTTGEIEDSFADPETMSFWRLPGFIRTMDATGFDSTRLRIRFQSLLSQPLLFAAMVLLAAVVALRPPRQRGTLPLVISGIATGLGVFLLSNFLLALGASHQLPPVLAAWSPALILLLAGLSALLTLEDG